MDGPFQDSRLDELLSRKVRESPIFPTPDLSVQKRECLRKGERGTISLRFSEGKGKRGRPRGSQQHCLLRGTGDERYHEDKAFLKDMLLLFFHVSEYTTKV